jgi:uncharacterized protein (TIGR02118 family)
MVKLVTLYRDTPDSGEFDRRFFEHHLPLVRAYPGLRGMEITRITGSTIGEMKYHVMMELIFDSQDSLQAALASPEGKAVSRDLLMFAPTVTTLIGETEGNTHT